MWFYKKNGPSTLSPRFQKGGGGIATSTPCDTWLRGQYMEQDLEEDLHL